jgi:predicted PurR-regulated permease PerM
MIAPMSSTPSRIRWFFLLSAVLCAAVAWGLALPLLGAAVLAFVSERPIDFILLKLRRSDSRRLRWVVATAFVVLIVAGLVLPLTFASIAAVREVIGIVSGVSWDGAADTVTKYVDWARNRAAAVGLDVPEQEVTDRIRSALASSFSFLGAKLGSLVSSTPTIVFDIVILLVSWVTFAVTGRDARDRVLPKLMPWDLEREILRKTTGEVLRSVLVANVVVSIAQSALCSIALLIVQMPRALVWGVLSFFLSFIPVVGTMPITIGAAIYCYSQGRVGAAIFMVVTAAAVGIVDNILRPIFMKSSANLSFLWMFVAFVGGVSLLGLPGVIVGPLAFSLFIAYLRAMEILPPQPGDPTKAMPTVEVTVAVSDVPPVSAANPGPVSLASSGAAAGTTPVAGLVLLPAPNKAKKRKRR